jgi:type III secretion protein U
MANNQSEEKTLPPSRKKLRDARGKGQVARSRDITSAISLAGAMGFLILGSGAIAGAASNMFETAGDVAAGNFAIGLRAVLGAVERAALRSVLPLLILCPLLVVVTALVTMRGIPFSVDPLIPRAEKINPVEGFKRLFKLRSLMELVKSLAKMLVIVALTLGVLAAGLNALIQLPSCGMSCLPDEMRALGLPWLASIVAMFLIIGAADVGLQRWLFLRDQKMGPSEAKRERKDMEGDPHLRRERRRIMREAVRLAAGLGLRRATMIVHDGDTLVVGVRYKINEMPAPVVVCRAQGPRAASMLAEARERRVPSAEDAGLAAGLHRVAPGHGIPERLFRPMALALARAGVV